MNTHFNSAGGMPRRDALKLVGGAVLAGVVAGDVAKAAELARTKKIVVAGGGIGGLCCGYELSKRGHDVTILEASARAGGHVRSVHDPFPGGLYADLGAEQCTKPGYELWRGYAQEFGLTLEPYRRRDNFIRYIGGKRYTEGDLRTEKVLREFGFNDGEVNFLKEHDWSDLPLYFYGKYFDRFKNEYEPFGSGLDELDDISATEHLKREGASEAALRFEGGRGSALHHLWYTAILHMRGVPLFPKDLFRVRGGNQGMTDAFAQRLGGKVKLSCPIREIRQEERSVTVRYDESEQPKTMEADYLVSAIPLPVLSRIKAEWPAEKKWVMENIHYNMQTRVVFQTRTRSWRKEGQSINISIGDPALHEVWEIANEVPGERGILMGSANPGTPAKAALEALHKYYPGEKLEVEQVITQDWFRDPWSPLCERESFGVGQLRKFWPELMRPHGRIHFVGNYADNLNWGMEAATRSANRVAKVIDAL